MICPKCKTKNDEDAVFCKKCGEKFIIENKEEKEQGFTDDELSIGAKEKNGKIKKGFTKPKAILVGLISFVVIMAFIIINPIGIVINMVRNKASEISRDISFMEDNKKLQRGETGEETLKEVKENIVGEEKTKKEVEATIENKEETTIKNDSKEISTNDIIEENTQIETIHPIEKKEEISETEDEYIHIETIEDIRGKVKISENSAIGKNDETKSFDEQLGITTTESLSEEKIEIVEETMGEEYQQKISIYEYDDLKKGNIITNTSDASVLQIKELKTIKTNVTIKENGKDVGCDFYIAYPIFIGTSEKEYLKVNNLIVTTVDKIMENLIKDAKKEEYFPKEVFLSNVSIPDLTKTKLKISLDGNSKKREKGQTKEIRYLITYNRENQKISYEKKKG